MWIQVDIPDVDSSTLLPAVEVNHARGISGEVVRLTFAGYRRRGDETIPLYVFQFEKDEANGTSLPLHDHRDNATGGGFAFAVDHPGTHVPQQPWYS